MAQATTSDTLVSSDLPRTILREIWNRPQLKIGASIVGVYSIMAVASLILPSPTKRVASGPLAPSIQHPFGTTWMGESVFIQFISSTKWALMIAAVSAVVTIMIGANVGLISGYYGGRVEEILMSITDMAMGLPVLPFGLVVAGVLGKSPIIITIAVGSVLWRTIARVVRSETKSIKEREFVTAARARGASDFRIIYVHILPNLLSLISIYVPLTAAWGLLNVAGIAFLGLMDPSLVTWGVMLQDVWSSGMMLSAPWWFGFPAFGIASLIVGLLFISRELEKITNPKLRSES